ncbi:methyltransferase [Vibrio superstes]|uniref:methyltransferase n=1 Tax=Vibrio superstes TaxID=198815 RepID=UPI000E5AD515|nr:methyltransferase [Vibrio superstes]
MASSSPTLWYKQTPHFVSLFVLLLISYFTWFRLGQPAPIAFWTAFSIPALHQIFVWLAWRLELQSSLVSKTLGFRAYLVIFFVLFVGRFLSLFLLAYLDRGTLGLNSSVQIAVTVICLCLSLYAIYSVRRYFGMARAAGADHFELSYRSLPMVNQGIFKYSSNSMYVYAFLLVWAIAIGLNSSAALIIAAYSHIYIWVHYYCTEKPDMDFIYSPKEP